MFFISILAVISISSFLVWFYKDEVIAKVIQELNKHLNSEVRVEPNNIDLTIMKSFPKCAIEFKEITVFESKNYKKPDTLLYAKNLLLAFSVKDLFNKNYTIKNITLIDAETSIKIDGKGNPNYLIWKQDTSSKSNNDLKFSLENILLDNIKFSFKSKKHKVKISSSIKTIHFKGSFSSEKYTLVTDGNAFVNALQIGDVKYINDKNLKFDLEFDVNGNNYVVKKSNTFVNETHLVSNGSFVIKDSLQSLDIEFNGNNLDISTTLSLLPEKFKTKIYDYESNGEFYVSGECHYKSNLPFKLNSNFGIKNASILHKQSSTSLQDVNLTGKIVMNENRSSLSLKNISAKLNNNNFSGNMELVNFSNPYLTLNFSAKTSLQDLMSFYPIDTLENLSGNIDMQANIEGLVSELKTNTFSSTIKANGEASVHDLKAKFKHSEKEINIPTGTVKLIARHLNVSNLKLIKGNSDVSLNGDLPDFLGYLFNHAEPLNVIALVNSDKIEVEDFLFASSNNQSDNGKVQIPNNININVKLNVGHLTFGKFKAEKFQGDLFLKDQKAALNNVKLNTTDGEITLNVIADTRDDKIKITGESELKQLNIQKLFFQLNNFGQTTIIDQNLKGFITANIDFSSSWDNQLNVDLSSINVTSSLLVERGELIGFKPLESLAKYIDVTELKHIKFSTLQSAVEIKNKVITIPKTSIKSNAINLELWGKHTFDNVIDYHIQLLLSEIIAKRPNKNKDFDDELSLVENDPENRRSVFIVMTGPIDNPIIKYDKKGAKEKIKEDIKHEKQNLKQILKEEFGFFKKDSTLNKKEATKSNQNFQIQIGEEKPKTNKPLQPKKKEEDDEDF